MTDLWMYCVRKLGILAIVCCAGLLWAHHALAMAPVEAVALFKDRAVVRTADGQEMLKVGQTSHHGVTLLRADTQSAQVRYRDELYTLVLSRRMASSFAKPTEQSVRISRDGYGQYRMRGAINGHGVNFLVDTGATLVAMSESHASAMGLSYLDGQLGSVTTAQGSTRAYFVYLDEVTLGAITRQNVRATVIQGSYPIDVLLGMSFLNSLRLSDNEGVLTLTAKF